MSSKLVKKNETEKKDVLLKVTAFLAGYVAIAVTGVLVFSIVTAISAKTIVDTIEEKTGGKTSSVEETASLEENQSSDISSSDIAEETLQEGLVLGEVYNGIFSSEMEDAGVVLRKVENISETMGVSYDGNIYTYENGEVSCEKIDGILQFNGETIDAKREETFDVLKEAGFELETDGDAKNYTYGEDEDGSAGCLVSVQKSEAYNSNGDTKECQIAYFYFGNNREDLSNFAFDIHGITAESSIGDVLMEFGTPSYTDVYEESGGEPYILLYYSCMGEDNAMNEMTFLFSANKEDAKGYVLSEITMSVF